MIYSTQKIFEMGKKWEEREMSENFKSKHGTEIYCDNDRFNAYKGTYACNRSKRRQPKDRWHERRFNSKVHIIVDSKERVINLKKIHF